MKKVLFVILLVVLVSGASLAELFDINFLALGTAKLKVRDKASGQPLWSSTLKIQKMTAQGQNYVYLEENGGGVYGKDKIQQVWKTQTYLKPVGKKLIPCQVVSVFKDQNGQTVTSVQKDYNQTDKKIYCQVNGKSSAFNFKPDVVDKESLGNALQNFPFGQKKTAELSLLTPEPTLYHITIKDWGIEDVKVGDKTVRCNKLEMIVDLGALSIFGAFVPKTYFWFEKDAPYSFVKYEGLESGLGTPYIVMERVIE